MSYIDITDDSQGRSQNQGRIQDFKLGGAHLKNLRRAVGGAKILGVFRVKNHDFTPKKIILINKFNTEDIKCNYLI
jgi:hypothetical protein